MYVDDEENLALLGQEFLGDLGYLVDCAYSGEQALELFVQQPDRFDLVITDESMPNISGIQLAQELYRLASQVPVVLCSGHLLTMNEAGMEQTNIQAVLVKTEVCTKLPEIIEALFAVD